MKKLIFILLLLAEFTCSVHAQRYLTNLTGATQTTFFGLGTGALPFTKSDFLNGVAKARQPALDPSTLELVFDVGTGQLLVVSRTDGATVVVVYTLSNNQEVDFGPGDIGGGPAEVIRRADLLEAGGTVPVGSIAGLLRRKTDPSDPVEFYRSYYRWVADFQVLSQTGGAFATYPTLFAGGQHQPMLLRGQFKVRNKPFVPGAVNGR